MSVNLIAFGTFGSPNGFRQTFFDGNAELAKYTRTFDLNSNAIRVQPNSKLYAIRKEHLNNKFGISYCLYTFAQERNSQRGGTFIGSSLLYTNEIANESLTVSILNEFHSNLVKNNVNNEIIQVSHSKELNVTKPRDYEKIQHNLKKIDSLSNRSLPNRSLVVYANIQTSDLVTQFEKSIYLLDKYDTIYFTDNNQIAEFVYKQGLYAFVKIEGFEKELEKLQTEKQQEVQNYLSVLENEKRKLQDDRRRVVNDLKEQFNKSQKVHSENERVLSEVGKNIEKIDNYYAEFSKRINDYYNRIESGGKIDEINTLYNQNLFEFQNSINTLKEPRYTTRINNPQTNTKLEPIQILEDNYPEPEPSLSQKKGKFNLFKITTVALSFLWISTLAYFLFFGNTDKPIMGKENGNRQPIEQNTTEPSISTQSDTLKVLKPAPNSQLNSNDLTVVNKTGLKNKSIEQVVEIIFSKNPSDIQAHYKNQKDLYKKDLINKNSACFLDSICICDSLKVIPSYK